MSETNLKARDLLPIVRQLSHDEQVRLAKLALHAASSNGSDADAYSASPPDADEFGSEEDSLAWDADGWDEFSAPR